MSRENLATYLNDHLAGSVTAVAMLQGLEKAHEETPLAAFLHELQSDIEMDRNELQSLMKRLDVTPSLPRRAAAWVSEKAVELKLKIDDSSGGELRLLES